MSGLVAKNIFMYISIHCQAKVKNSNSTVKQSSFRRVVISQKLFVIKLKTKIDI